MSSRPVEDDFVSKKKQQQQIANTRYSLKINGSHVDHFNQSLKLNIVHKQYDCYYVRDSVRTSVRKVRTDSSGDLAS